MKISFKILAFAVGSAFIVSCGGDPGENAVDPPTPNESAAEETDPSVNVPNKGVGPITSIIIPEEVDAELAKKGEELFTVKCTACHKIDARYVGPALQGVTQKRTPEWIMNMIMVPEQMVAEDPDAKALLAEFLAPMANQSITEEEARALYEYLRTNTVE